eukprot:g50115.t1
MLQHRLLSRRLALLWCVCSGECCSTGCSHDGSLCWTSSQGGCAQGEVNVTDRCVGSQGEVGWRCQLKTSAPTDVKHRCCADAVLPSSTPSLSASASKSVVSPSSSPSLVSQTPSNSLSPTNTPSITPTASISMTASVSLSASPSLTGSHSLSASPVSPTISTSPTASLSILPTSSTSLSPSTSPPPSQSATSSVSVSASQSATSSISLTSSRSATSSVSVTASQSAVSMSATASPGASTTSSTSVTASQSAVSMSATASPGASTTSSTSVTAFPSSTSSVSVTASPSLTSSTSVTVSVSATSSLSMTVSVSATSSESVTASMSLSSTATQSATSSVSITASQSATRLVSVTASQSAVSMSATASPGASTTSSTSVTASASPSSTSSVSVTGSVSATSSVSITASQSATRSVSVTASPEASATSSVSVSASRSATSSVSVSVTASQSATSSVSVTPAESATSSGSVSPPSIEVSACFLTWIFDCIFPCRLACLLTCSFYLAHAFAVAGQCGDCDAIYTEDEATGLCVDTFAPTIACPSSMTVSTDASVSTAAVSYAQPLVSDNLPLTAGTTATLQVGLTSGAKFPLGSTTCAYSVTDAAGLSSTCEFVVTVVDTEAPAFSPACSNVKLGGPDLISDADGFATPAGFAPWTSKDNVDGAVALSDVEAATSTGRFPVGITSAVLVATDAAGNVARCKLTYHDIKYISGQCGQVQANRRGAGYDLSQRHARRRQHGVGALCGLCFRFLRSGCRFHQLQPVRPGFFAASSGSAACLACPQGTTAPTAGSQLCADPGQCPAGTFSATGSQPCTACPDGKVTSLPNQTSCTPCPVNTAPNPSRVFCVACALGYVTTGPGGKECLLKGCTDPAATPATYNPNAQISDPSACAYQVAVSAGQSANIESTVTKRSAGQRKRAQLLGRSSSLRHSGHVAARAGSPAQPA